MDQNSLFADEREFDDAPKPRISVLVTVPMDKTYTYALEEGESLMAGTYVRVNVGPRSLIGVVWDDEADEAVPEKKLKPVTEVLDMPPLPEIYRRLVDRVAAYTMSKRGAVLKMVLSVPTAFDPPKTTKYYAAQEGVKNASTPKRQKALDILKQKNYPMKPSVLSKMSGVSVSVLKAMGDAGEIAEEYIAELPPCISPKIDKAQAPQLSQEQREAAEEMRLCIGEGGYHTLLLDGVTGSGKTEVYFEAVEKALEMGRQVLIMLPEIALSNAFFDRFKARFGAAPAMWHSALTPAQRRKTWRGVAEGKTRVVIGARSSLFLPFRKLGLIIVDEEHDPSYKQEDGVFYNARDMAVMLSFLNKTTIVLVSATPALETIHNVITGRYQRLSLPSRFGGAELPDIHLIDMKQDKTDRHHFLSSALRDVLQKNFEAGFQSLLFLNRRGYAPLTLCCKCGHRYECPQCTAWLVEHRGKYGGKSFLQCHHCGFSGKLPENCTNCHEVGSLVPCGPGVERIAEEVAEIFPQMRRVILASDLKDDENDMATALEMIREGAVDIIIGTQIVAKGYHFPRLTCVGVIDADLGLKGGDLRASERTWQLLHQVAGRAGRGEHEGHVYIQSYMPDNRLMVALSENDRDGFLKIEMEEREASFMPPFSRLAGLIISGKDEKQCESVARQLGRSAPHGEGFNILGPAPAQMYMLRGNYRFRFLVQADKKIDMQKLINHWIEGQNIPSTVRVQIDIDPQSFF